SSSQSTSAAAIIDDGDVDHIRSDGIRGLDLKIIGCRRILEIAVICRLWLYCQSTDVAEIFTDRRKATQPGAASFCDVIIGIFGSHRAKPTDVASREHNTTRLAIDA